MNRSTPPRPARLRLLVVLAGLVLVGVACVQGDSSSEATDVSRGEGSDPGWVPPGSVPGMPATADPVECRRQFVGLRRALHERWVETNSYPTTPEQLATADIGDFPAYTVEPRVAGNDRVPPVVVPAPDSPCPADPPGGFTDVGVQDQVCETELRAMRTAVEAYRAMVGSPPDSTQDLVDQAILVEASTLYEVLPGGDLVPVGGGRCL